MKSLSYPRLLQLLTMTLLWVSHSSAFAAEEIDPSVKLREQLRAVTLQLRTAQTESANAQATTAASEQNVKDLTLKIETLEKRNVALIKEENADKMEAARAIAALEAKNTAREKRLVLVQEALVKWQAGYKKAAALAVTKETERERLASELISTKHTVADRERKNIALFNTANEILTRYQNYALGSALLAKEPFVGTTRVKIENLVQGYQDKILDHRIAAPTKRP